MDRINVDSKNISKIGYSVSQKILEITFWNGDVYEYYEVPIGIRAEMIASDSIGKFFHSRIKDNFAFKKINK